MSNIGIDKEKMDPWHLEIGDIFTYYGNTKMIEVKGQIDIDIACKISDHVTLCCRPMNGKQFYMNKNFVDKEFDVEDIFYKEAADDLLEAILKVQPEITLVHGDHKVKCLHPDLYEELLENVSKLRVFVENQLVKELT